MTPHANGETAEEQIARLASFISSPPVGGQAEVERDGAVETAIALIRAIYVPPEELLGRPAYRATITTPEDKVAQMGGHEILVVTSRVLRMGSVAEARIYNIERWGMSEAEAKRMIAWAAEQEHHPQEAP